MQLIKRIKCRDFDEGTWILVFYTGKDLHCEEDEGDFQGVVLFPDLEEISKVPCILTTTTQLFRNEVKVVDEALSFLHLRRKMGKPLRMSWREGLDEKLIEAVKPKAATSTASKQEEIKQVGKE